MYLLASVLAETGLSRSKLYTIVIQYNKTSCYFVQDQVAAFASLHFWYISAVSISLLSCVLPLTFILKNSIKGKKGMTNYFELYNKSRCTLRKKFVKY